MSEARDPGVLGTLFRYELKMLVRDTRMLIIAVAVPLLLFPALILVMRVVRRREAQRLETTTYVLALTGDRKEWAQAIVGRAIRREQEDPDTARGPVRFTVLESAAADSLLRIGKIHVVVDALSGEAFARREASGPAGAEAEPDSAGTPPDLPVLELRYRARSDFSRRAMTRLRQRISEVREEMRDSAYLAGGLPIDPARLAVVRSENVASAETEGGALVGLLVTPFVLLLMLSGGSILAVDAISGEKERGTLETLLTTAATRAEIVTAKQLAIIVVGMAVALVNVLNLLLYLGLGLIELPENFAVSPTPLALVLVLVLLAPLTVLVSSGLLLLSGFAKSYKEYQIYFFPLCLVFLAPSLAGMLPGMKLRSAIAFVPVAGIGVAVREVMVGEYDWPFIGVALGSSAVLAWWLARITARALSTERLVSGVDLDRTDVLGGPGLFPRHVLRWFGLMWVTFFVVSLWFGEGLGARGQVLVNLLAVFLGGSVLVVRRYRLSARDAFALRRPHPLAWLAVAVGAPSGYVLGIGIATFVNTYVFPVPRSVLDAFGEFVGMGDIPLWQLVLFFALMPAILEEMAFRGLLLHGLRRKLSPVGLCLAVGGIFGLFHVSLFRLAPTACLGALLAAVVVLTGSIFPAMLWHLLNNLIAIVPSYLGWVGDEVGLPWWAFAASALGVAACFLLLWRARRPYPGLRRRATGEVSLAPRR